MFVKSSKLICLVLSKKREKQEIEKIDQDEMNGY